MDRCYFGICILQSFLVIFGVVISPFDGITGNIMLARVLFCGHLQQLMRYSENLEKNHQAEMSIQQEHYQQTSEALKEVSDRVNAVKNQLAVSVIIYILYIEVLRIFIALYFVNTVPPK